MSNLAQIGKQKAQKKLIEELTPAQIARLEDYYKMGVDIGLDTRQDTFDAGVASGKIRELTDIIRVREGLSKAKYFLTFDSPQGAINAIPSLSYSNCQFYGNHDSYWLVNLAFYRFELGLIEETNAMVELLELAKMSGWLWFSGNATVVTRKPSELHFQDKVNSNPVLHNANGHAIRYPDGVGYYYMNDIFIPKEFEWVVTTPADKLDARRVLSISNTSVRNEAMKKLGPDRLPKEQMQLLDKAHVFRSDYELYSVDFGADRPRVYLSGTCPSSGVAFFEAVPPEIRTCRGALGWREYDFEVGEAEVYHEPVIRT